MKYRMIFLSFVFYLLSLPLFSEVHRNTAYFLEWGENSFSEEEKMIIEGSIIGKISKIDCLLITEVKFSSDSEKIITYTKENKFDSYISIFLGGSFEDFIVKWEIYDFTFDRILDTTEMVAIVDRDFTNLLGGFWIRFTEKIENLLFSFSLKVPVRFKTLPNAFIYGLERKAVQVDENGFLRIFLESHKSYKIAVKLAGYHTEYLEIFSEESSETLKIDLTPKFNVNLDIGFHDLTYLRMGIGYYFLPDKLFFQFATTIYQAQLMVMGGDSDYNLGSNNIPQINTLSFRLGGNIDLSQHHFRIPIGIEFALRMSSVSEDKLDPIAFASLEIPLAFEIFIHKNILLCFEWSPTMYMTKNYEIFSASMNLGWKGATIFPSYPLSAGGDVSVVFDFLRFNMGVKFQL